MPADTEKALVALLPRLSGPGKARLLRVMADLGSKAIQKHAAAVIESLLETVEGDEAARPSASPRPGRWSSCCRRRRRRREAARRRLAPAPRPASSPASSRPSAPAPPRRGRRTGPAPGRLTRPRPGRPPCASCSAGRRRRWRCSTRSRRGRSRSSDLALDQRQALADHPDRAVRARARKMLARGGDLPNADRQKVVDELMPLTKKTGDAAKGKAVFKANCAKCHVHSGEGDADRPGPDRHGQPPQGGTARPHHGPEPVRRGQLPRLDRDDDQRPGVRRHARLGDAHQHRADRRRGQAD